MVAACECVFAVAPDAAHRAAGQAHERAWPPGVRRFSLNRAKDFSYAQHVECQISTLKSQSSDSRVLKALLSIDRELEVWVPYQRLRARYRRRL